MRARIITVDTDADAAKAKDALQHGMSFEDAARAFSKDASAVNGGDLGYVQQGAVLPELSAVMFALAPGQSTSFPIPAGGALYFVQVEDRKQMPPLPLDVMRGVLTQQLARAAVPDVIAKALDGLPVEDYGIAGKGGSSAMGSEQKK